MSEAALDLASEDTGVATDKGMARQRVTDGRNPQLWRDFGDHPSCSLFASRLWVEAVADTYGFNVSASVLMASEIHEAALVFSDISDLRGDRIVCFPFCDYSDPFVDNIEAWHRVVDPLLARNVPVSIRCLRNSVVAKDERFRLASRAAWHAVDLTRPEDVLWAGLRGKERTRIRHASAIGLTVRAESSLEAVHMFYAMHCQVRKTKYRLLPQPITFFEKLHATFSPDDRMIILLAEFKGEPVAGALLIEYGRVLYYKFAASVDRSASPNDLLIWEAIRLGQRRGLAQFDFGASDLDQPSLLDFKRKYATEEREIQRLIWEPPGFAPASAALASRILGDITKLLTDPRVPDSITRAGGDALYGQFC